MAWLDGVGETLRRNMPRAASGILTLFAMGFGALMWLTGAMIVALPTTLFNWDIPGSISEFFHKPIHPATVLLLWIIDVVIAVGVLRDSKVLKSLLTGRRAAMCFAGIGAFIFTGILVPGYSASGPAQHPYVMVTIALIGILVPRALSYTPAVRPRRFGAT